MTMTPPRGGLSIGAQYDLRAVLKRDAINGGPV
jgi:hypothetical protein